MKKHTAVLASAIAALAGITTTTTAQHTHNHNHHATESVTQDQSSKVRYATESIDGLDIFYREAGTPGQP
ncbi:MAG: hypothetical protein P1U30_03185, partial [Phycisphaerales bacterium]|nr:hypothetical protein [Phycisphaerales bacterium]